MQIMVGHLGRQALAAASVGNTWCDLPPFSSHIQATSSHHAKAAIRCSREPCGLCTHTAQHSCAGRLLHESTHCNLLLLEYCMIAKISAICVR